MIRQRNGNMRKQFRVVCWIAQRWANMDDCPYSIVRTPNGYDWIPVGEPFTESPATYIAMTVHPRKDGEG